MFAGTRVPTQTLFDYIEAGQPLTEFLKDFPTVSKELDATALRAPQPGVSRRLHVDRLHGPVITPWREAQIASGKGQSLVPC